MFAMCLGGVALELGVWGAVKVFGMRLGYEMGRIAARRVVACVANLHAGWNRAVSRLVGEAVRKHCSALSPAFAEMAVATGQAPASPLPTFLWPTLIDFRPKAFFGTPDDLFRTVVHERVSVPLESSVVHSAPRSFFGWLQTVGNRACHVYQYTPCRRVA